MALPVNVDAARLPAARSGEVGVYWMSTDAAPAALSRAQASVDAATLERARRMRREADGHRILLAHALLRQVLGQLLGRAPAALEIARRCSSCGATDHGRPYLAGGPSFGLSHGGEVVAIAVAAPQASVSIDVEADQPPARWEAVRRHAFTAADWAASAEEPGPQRTAIWARKEAVVKAMGLGLELGLTRLHLPPASGALQAVAVDDGAPPAPDGPWCVADVQLAAGHQAAVALHGAAGDWQLLAPQQVRLAVPHG